MPNRPPPRPATERLALAGATLAIIATGTILRLLPVGLPAGFVKYGGSVLWGAMVYGFAAIVLLRPRWRIVVMAGLVALAVELFRLVHAPALDAFRLTLAGQLLLGRIFSPWNLVAYAAGIALAALTDAGLRRRTG